MGNSGLDPKSNAVQIHCAAKGNPRSQEEGKGHAFVGSRKRENGKGWWPLSAGVNEVPGEGGEARRAAVEGVETSTKAVDRPSNHSGEIVVPGSRSAVKLSAGLR